jgi:hypothetical protein
VTGQMNDIHLESACYELPVFHVRCLMYSLIRRILDQEQLRWQRRLAF